jgi:DNA primase
MGRVLAEGALETYLSKVPVSKHMALRIPQDVIEKIRSETPIEEVIRHFLPLQSSGRTYKARCPFHNEKTPSFHAIPEKQIFYCYGCHKGGDVFRFLMEKEGMGFPEAVEWCASRLGLDLSRYASEEPAASHRAALFQATAWAAQWFAEQLKADDGSTARRYARERGLKPETLDLFGIGYAPEDSARFLAAAEQAKISTETLLQVSLLARKEERPPFAYFRSRLIFPIHGVAAKIHGFGGRSLGPYEPKYLNSPETSIFQKRSVLYGLSQARARIIRARRAVLVEGYIDALMLHQAGWGQTVATCGTAFTKEQASILRRYAESVDLLFDGDTAGRKAAFKAADMALAAGLDVRLVRVPEGRDPADLLLDGEVSLLQRAFDSAQGLVAALAEEVAERGDRRELKEHALHHIRETLTKVEDPIRAELMAQEAAETFGVRAGLLLPREDRVPPRRRQTATPVREEAEDEWVRNERAILRFAMTSRAARHRLFETLTAEDFKSPALREIFTTLHAMDAELDESCDLRILEHVAPETQSLLTGLLADLPDEGMDSLAEIDAALRQREQLGLREESAVRRQTLTRKYLAGEEWRSDLPATGIEDTGERSET